VLLVVVIRVAGTGSGSSTVPSPAISTPVASIPTQVASATAAGARVVADAQTPAAFTSALRDQQVIVVGFVLRGVADDDAVASALAGLASPQEAVPGVRYLVYNVATGDRYGDLATILGISDTPSVVIIGADGHIANEWDEYVDAGVISAALQRAITATAG